MGPLIIKNDFEPLRHLIEAQGIQWTEGEINACLEYDDRNVFNEDTGQPTSIDFVTKIRSRFRLRLRKNCFGGVYAR